MINSNFAQSNFMQSILSGGRHGFYDETSTKLPSEVEGRAR